MAAGRVAVIGAGLAGLAAAVELADSAFDVELFERSRLLGGRATSFELDGVEVDNGQHVFLGCCTEFIRFVEHVGMATCLHLQERFDAVVLTRSGDASHLRAAALPSPWHLLASFVGYRHLGWSSKMRVARALAQAGGAHRYGGTFAQWLARHGQTEEALNAFWRPFFVPALNAPLEEVSASDAAFVLSTAFLGDAGAARVGFTSVPLAHVAAAAAKRLDEVHLSSAVTRLEISPDGHSARGIVIGESDVRPFDAVVIAVPPPQLARIAGDPQRIGLPPLDGFKPQAIVDAHLWHDGGRVGFDFAALIDSPVQWIFEKDAGYLCASMSAADRFLTAPTDDVTRECWQEVVAAVPALRGAHLLRSALTRNPQATYAASPGQVRPGPTTSFANVTVAGSWTDTGWPDTMESAVRSGLAAARRLNETMRGARVA